MDFTSDCLYNGRRFRVLTIIDNFSRECLAIEVEYLDQRSADGQRIKPISLFEGILLLTTARNSQEKRLMHGPMSEG